jgi:hypothetical protein
MVKVPVANWRGRHGGSVPDLAALTAFGWIAKVPVLEEDLFARGKDEFATAVDAG